MIDLPNFLIPSASAMPLLPVGKPLAERARLDVAGAITVTAPLMLAVYAIVHGNEAGWTSAQTLAQLGIAIALMIAFLVIESRVSHPLMPLHMFALRNVATANVVGVVWAAALFAWFFISALCMHRVLNYSAMHAMKTVDVDAKVNVDIDTKTVSVDSWLMPEEFLVAFVDEDYDVTIVEA